MATVSSASIQDIQPAAQTAPGSNGSVTVAFPRRINSILVQNNTSQTIYVCWDGLAQLNAAGVASPRSAATQGDLAVATGATAVYRDVNCLNVYVYVPANTVINGTTAGVFVIGGTSGEG